MDALSLFIERHCEALGWLCAALTIIGIVSLAVGAMSYTPEDEE